MFYRSVFHVKFGKTDSGYLNHMGQKERKPDN